MNTLEKIKNVFKWISFGLLVFVATTTLIALLGQIISDETKITDKIYDVNSFLCILSIILGFTYLMLLYAFKPSNVYKKSKIKNNGPNNKIKTVLKKFWPCILLVIFMGWTAVGCIQASMEAQAEAALRDEIEENDTERNKEIAAWTSGDRMKNAADRSWNGCDNLKDGYFSFLFYAMVAVNVVMLGAKSDNLKKLLLRILLISGLILIFLSLMHLLNPIFLGGRVNYHRAIFNNSNHYGYYLCIISMLCVTMFVKDKNPFFKGISLLGFVLSSFMLIVNNTFGAYLGVMVAIGVMFIFFLFKALFEFFTKEEKYINSLFDFAKIAIISIIFAFFSFTVMSAQSVMSTTEQYYMQKSNITFTFTQRDNTLVISSNQAVMRNTTFTKSGDNRVYTTDKKVMKLVESLEDYDASATYYKIEEFLYELVDEDVIVEEKTPDTFPTKTIIKTNFEQLGKDIGIIFNHFEKENNNNSVIENNAENTSENKVEENEENKENKSGLSDAVSNTGSGRGEVWLKSLDLIKQRPLFGWGLENMLNEFYYQYGINEGRTHNLILQLAGTTGIFGMLFYMIAVIAIFFKVISNYKNWGVIEYIAVPTFIAYMVSSMFGNSAFYTSPYFMIILGMMIASMIYKEKNESNKKLEKATLNQLKK